MLVDLQIAEDLDNEESIPTSADFEKWAGVVPTEDDNDAELTIRVVSEAEISELNQTYRDKTGPTNVLSFPFEMPDFGYDQELGDNQVDEFSQMHIPLLGDLVVCAAVVTREAVEQNKPLAAHWAHMTIHGVLHLLGYDHIEMTDAEEMERLEITLLSELGYPTPY